MVVLKRCNFGATLLVSKRHSLNAWLVGLFPKFQREAREDGTGPIEVRQFYQVRLRGGLLRPILYHTSLFCKLHQPDAVGNRPVTPFTIVPDHLSFGS